MFRKKTDLWDPTGLFAFMELRVCCLIFYGLPDVF